jgi:hypothetical protein
MGKKQKPMTAPAAFVILVNQMPSLSLVHISPAMVA